MVQPGDGPFFRSNDAKENGPGSGKLPSPNFGIFMQHTSQNESVQASDPDLLIDTALDRPLVFTRFPDQSAQSKKQYSKSLRELRVAIRKKSAASKSDLPWIKLATFGDDRSEKNCLRHNGNVMAISGIEGDYDAEEVTPQQAADRLKAAGVAALIYTTASHTPEAPRWRVLVPLSRDHAPSEREALCARLNGVLDGILTKESFTLSQAYYYGSVAGGHPVETVLIDGNYLDDVHGLAEMGKNGAAYVPRPAASPYSLDDLLAPAPAAIDWAEVKRALYCIPPEIEYPEWRKVGGALHHASEGRAEGFALWQEWSETADFTDAPNRKPFDLQSAQKVWEEFGVPPRHFNVESLFYIARQHGYESQRIVVSADDFDDLPAWHVADFDADEVPDLSHDQLALDLGRSGWDNDARYVAELGGWLLWKDHYWQPSPSMQPMSIVRDFVRAKAAALMRWAEASAKAQRLDDEATKNLIAATRNKAKAMRQGPAIVQVENLARANPCSLSRPEQWDADDMLLGTPGGTVDLRTGELRRAQRQDYITKCTSVAPAAPEKQPEAWLKFLAEVFSNDPDMPRFIQRLAGYALTGSTQEHRLFLFHGSGRNGKGTLLNTLEYIMGDYAKGVPTSALLETRGTQHASPIARLRGARLVRGAELPVGQTWNESLVKQLTGGDTITANLMRQDSFEFTPKFTLIIDGNTKPRIRTTDVAMKARMTLVPFTASFVGREDRGLPDRLKAEAGAILRWMIDGAVAWHREGLGIPAAVEAASTAYLAAEDVLADFIADEITQDLGAKVTVKELYQRYLEWCDQERSKPMSKRALSDAMGERGYDRANGAQNVAIFPHISLRDHFSDGEIGL